MKYLALALAYLPCYTLANSQAEEIPFGTLYELYSEVLSEERQFAIFTPADYANNSIKYQVLYVLDGEWNFHYSAALVDKLSSSGLIPATIVVGVINQNRSRDLTPPGAKDNPRFGGGQEFLAFLTNELKPWVETNYRTHPFSTLAGHSFGGLLTVYAVMEAPGAFQAYIALSPSLGRNGEQEIKRAKEFFDQSDMLPARLYLGVGDEGGHTFLSSRKLAEIAAGKTAFQPDFMFDHLISENHVSITTTGLSNGLKFVHEGFDIERRDELDDMFLVKAHYEALSARYGYEQNMPEISFQKFVNEQILQGEYDYALYILDNYQQVYPDSHNLLAAYATTYLLQGDFKKARAYYLKLRELGIEDQYSSRILEQLRDED